MANLTQESLARRDAALNTPPPASGRSSYTPPLERERQAALSYRERHDADLAAARASIEAQRAADREAGLASKAQHYENLNNYKDQRLEQFATAQKIAQAKADLESERQKTKADHTLEILNQATGFLKDARGMDPSKKEFDSQYQDLVSGYPLAAEHPAVKEWMDYHRPLREKFVAAEIAADKQRTAAQVDAMKTRFDKAQAGLAGATDEAIAFRAANPGKALDPKLADKLSGFQKAVDLTGQRLAAASPDTAEDVAAAAKGALSASLLRQHGDLEAKFKDDKGNFITDPAQIAALVSQINPIKKQLGFDQLDAAGKAVPKTVIPAAPAAVTVGTPAPSSTIIVPAAPSGDVTQATPAPTPVSPATFPADSDFATNHDEPAQSNFIPHAVPGYTSAAGTVDSGDGNLHVYDGSGKFLSRESSSASPEIAAARTAAQKPYDDLHSTADAAIKSGAPVEAVKARLVQLGGNPARLTYDD